MRRRFSKSERNAVEIVTGRSGEADHIKPYSKGGKTAVENCQIIGAKANRMKSASDIVFREWQSEFFDKWDERETGKPFTLIAIPGGGKTFAALEVARRWMAAGSDRRLIVVVPTDNLREQWSDEACKFGLSLQTKEFGTNFKHGFQGGVASYQLVANQPLLFRTICSVAPTLVVFDEIHHCGDDSSFGEGIKVAFELSKEKLLLSGTLWKTNGKPIPFVTYDGGGYSIGDFAYDYPRALNEEVVRYLAFHYAKGSISNDVTGETEIVSQDISDEEAQKRLRRLLDPDGDYVREQILDAHRKLMVFRETIPDAAALAACIDQFHALKVAKVIREVTGVEPSVIVSDADMENDSVKKFRKSRKEWLVAVRKVSEGTDIKRLQVLCYLTNTTTELFFRQLVGRVSRFRDMEDFQADVYLPSDPRLIRCAENIENAQIMALKQPIKPREFKEREQGVFEFDSYSTSHDGTELVLIGNRRVPLSEAKRIEVMAEKSGVFMQKVLQILELNGQSFVHVEEEPTEVRKEERMDALRAKCSKLGFRLSKLLDCEPRDIHGRFKNQKYMTEEELQSKLEQLVCEIKKVGS